MLLSTHTSKRPWDIVDNGSDIREDKQFRKGIATPFEMGVSPAVAQPTSGPKSQFMTSFYPSTRSTDLRSFDSMKSESATQEAFQRLSDYTWLTAISPLRLYLGLLVFWRVLLPNIVTLAFYLLVKLLTYKFKWIFKIAFIHKMLYPYSKAPSLSKLSLAMLG